MMSGKVKNQSCARNLHVERKVLPEAMLPIHREAEEVDIKLPRLGLIENTQDGADTGEAGGVRFVRHVKSRLIGAVYQTLLSSSLIPAKPKKSASVASIERLAF